MQIDKTAIRSGLKAIRDATPSNVTLVAVSKTKPIEAIEVAYAEGQRDFGENRIQELIEKNNALPGDIRWHAIGHLQTNKVKDVVPIAHLVHAVDSKRLYDALGKCAGEKFSNEGEMLDVLLQVHIAQEESKFGWSPAELMEEVESEVLSNPSLRIRGLMGMATFTDDHNQIAREFRELKQLYDRLSTGFNVDFDTLSMGMSGDWRIAIDEGSTMIRVGSSIFGARG